MAGISRLALLLAVNVRLADQTPGITIYNGEVDLHPPVKVADDQPDPFGRVGPYTVLFPSPGTPSRDGADLAETHQDLEWLLQLHVTAGYLEDLLQAVDDIDTALHNWAPVIDGIGFNGLRPPLGYDPGPTRRNDDAEPSRHWVPLQYRLTATR